jgi:hypothetical protein
MGPPGPRGEAVQVAAELQELGALLDRLDVAVKLVPGQLQGGEQVAYSAVAVRLSGPNSSMQKTT